MGYTPYKMSGHELKGIKQKGVPFSGGVGSDEMESGVADTINASPNNFFGAIGNIFKKKKGKKPGGGFGNLKEMDSRITALEEGGSSGGGGEAAAAMTPEIPGASGVTPEMSGAQNANAMIEKTGFGGVDASKAALTMMSDIRLKEKIEKAGKSPSGIPIYVFSYIGDNRRYEGAMAQDLISMGIDAVETQESGYYSVDYSKIDVDMKLIN